MDEIQHLSRIPELVREFDLKNIKEILKHFHNPHKSGRFVHVAGTNGKGSTCAMIAEALALAGYKVGLYTSPNLKRLNERIQINRREINNKDLNRLIKEVRIKASRYGIPLTFYEFVTAVAFIYFKEQNVDYIVLETGMGGRLDATNIIKPVVAIITNISIDHTKHLGDTITKIAKEKAGIIKKKGLVITKVKGTALEVIKKQARKQQAQLIIPKKQKMILGLKGEFQQENAALAYAALEQLHIKRDVIEKAFKRTVWPGRFEFIRKNVLLDCAHNNAGVDALVKDVRKLNYKKLILVFGVLSDKDIVYMAKRLEPLADAIILTKPKNKRAADPKDIAYYFKKGLQLANIKQAAAKARKLARKDDLVLITGSIFTVAEARSCF